MARQTRVTIATAIRTAQKKLEKDYNSGFIKKSTYKGNKSSFRTLSKLIGRYKLTELNAAALENFFNEELLEVVHSKGIGYKDKTRLNMHTSLKYVYEHYYKRDMIRVNPFLKGVKVKRKNDGEPILPYLASEIKALLSVRDGTGIVEGFYFACREGLRVSELIALTEQNSQIFDKEPSVLIDKALVLDEFNNTKTKQSERNICITRNSANIIADLLSKPMELESYTIQGVTYQDRFVFCNPKSGKNWGKSNSYYEALKPYFERAGIEFRGIQPTRHTYATESINSGVEIRAVSEQMGHSNTVTTLKHYYSPTIAKIGKGALSYREMHDPYANMIDLPLAA
ncbi:tyrosine-type recombinase/integrase [Vibrio jasicida]|uniref:tyrosine-type recombinase/integrase n=1 Tax=Vibrio jasicida TaxID=766224 RepID=UPI0007AF161E|nr:site-specific integrase [Vibrio jasicida]